VTEDIYNNLRFCYIKGDMKIMIKLLRNRLALSTVVTTLIILVVSVLLATVVVYYATNVVSTRVQEESLSLTKQHIWVEMNGTCVTAIMITNTGGRDVVLSKIAVRGQDVDASNILYVVAGSGDTLTTDLNWTGTAPAAAGDTVGGISSDTLTALSTNTLILTSGSTMAIYINSPDSITVNDIGLTVAITVFTSQAIHYQESNVEAVV
jgi:hypothetical protein